MVNSVHATVRRPLPGPRETSGLALLRQFYRPADSVPCRALKRFLSIPRRLIFDSSVWRGMPSLAAASKLLSRILPIDERFQLSKPRTPTSRGGSTNTVRSGVGPLQRKNMLAEQRKKACISAEIRRRMEFQSLLALSYILSGPARPVDSG